ncbi:hypothetical protein Tco_0384590 [Tanacetum coccineum]
MFRMTRFGFRAVHRRVNNSISYVSDLPATEEPSSSSSSTSSSLSCFLLWSSLLQTYLALILPLLAEGR